MFLYFTVSRPVLGPIQPPVKLVPGAPSPATERPERDVHNLSPSIAGVKNFGAIPPLLHTSSWSEA
jgi:hypothetical protein